MRLLAVLILILIFQSVTSNGQELKRNTIYLEAGGASFFYSINYDRLIFDNDEKNLVARIGVMYLPLFNDLERVFVGVPVSISYINRTRKNFFEFGISASAISDTYYAGTFDSFGNLGVSDIYIEDLVLIGSTRIGIRHQPSENRLFWNTLFQFSLIVVGDQNDFSSPFEISTMPLLSIGVGYSF